MTNCTIVSQNVALHAIMVSNLTIAQTDVTIAAPWQLATGSTHDYLVLSSKCYSRHWELSSPSSLPVEAAGFGSMTLGCLVVVLPETGVVVLDAADCQGK